MSMMGMLYKISDRSYRKFLKLKAGGNDDEASRFSDSWKQLGYVKELINVDVAEAEGLLSDMVDDHA